MFAPARCGQLFGIPILVVPALIPVLFLAFAMAGAGGTSFWLIASLLLIVAISLLVHELAHALVARYLGLEVLDITITPFGGMARMRGTLLRPGLEAPVAAAGPVANLFLAGLCFLLPGQWAEIAVWINLVFGLGNLVPAFPLDGGRLLRAWFASYNPMVDATYATVRIARWLALIVFGTAIYLGSFWLGLIMAIYLWWNSTKELIRVMTQEQAMPRKTVGEVIRACYSGQRVSTGTADAPSTETPPTHEAEPVDEDLENFRGSLDEYFEKRQRNDS